ncbi:MAG: anaerobic sulfatase maturase [Candidatus Aminicenantes bacterium RBG_13_64_14]|nr:MAG: anaerobic sulfatase maturase [Candidatus Aminicenantes bacterium RBG_13_64_14]
MTVASRGFQVFVKPAGAACNLACRYCYYLEKRPLGPEAGPPRMPEDILERYIAQHIAASPDEIVRFSWHGGEPAVLGVDYFRTIVEIQRRLYPPGRRIANGMQTNGTLFDEDWGRFLAAERFAVGLSLDGPRDLHDRHRLTRNGQSTFDETMRGYEILVRHCVPTDILCVVSGANARCPSDVYGFFREIGASCVTFLPLVEPRTEAPGGVSPESVPSEAWGDFLCAVFDEWQSRDIGRIKVQIIEEAARTAFGQEHSVCIFRPVCGDIPVVERNGDFFSCDHYVDAEHCLGNIRETPLVELLESPHQRAFGLAKLGKLPEVCRSCDVRVMCNGECPKNRFSRAPDGEPGLNYLCAGYKKFFRRVRPFVEAVADVWARQKTGTKT